MTKLAQKAYCVVLIKDFEDSIKLNVSNNNNYDCIEIDASSSISDDEFLIKTYPSGGTGMLMLKANPSMPDDIWEWTAPKLGLDAVPTIKY